MTYAYVALLDVLGYRFRLAEDRKSGGLSFKDSLQNALRVFETVNEADFHYQAISDTILVSCSHRGMFPEFLEVVRRVFVAFLEDGMFLRGGVTFEKHFKSANLTYSHAVARAYEIESARATYPRIVVDENILAMLHESGELDKLLALKLLLHANGTVFLNVADERNWAQLYEWGRAMFNAQQSALLGRESEFAKHVWFERYLMEHPCRVEGHTRYIRSQRYVESDDIASLVKPR